MPFSPPLIDLNRSEKKERPFCKSCGTRSAAVNYIRNNIIHYRSCCDQCIRQKKNKKLVPGWVRSGYKKKERCEKCGFRSRWSEQLTVYHIDGNIKNCSNFNLKTICKNCEVDIKKSGFTWSDGTLLPDR
jgi:hypothetical protein